MDDAFYVDGEEASCFAYEELVRAVESAEGVPPVLAWEGDVAFFIKLLAAVRVGSTVVLVDEPGDVESAALLLQVERSSPHKRNAPHPQPLSPEYRGEGSYAPSSSGKTVSSDCLLRESGGGRIGLFTSGTTGKPKLVLHSVDSLTRGVRRDPMHAQDVWGLAYHPAHMAGLQVFFQALANRNKLVRLFGLPIEQIHAAIEGQGITHLSATPTFLNLLCASGRVHRHVRSVSSGGELSSPALRDRLSATFPSARLRNIYASTEAGSLFVATDDAFRVPERLSGRVRVVDGELFLHRSLLAESLQRQLDDEYYATGDCVEVLQQDPLTFRITSRQTDWINVGGYKVNPHRVETLLLAMDEVLQAAVYGRENSVTGNLVCCDVVLAEGRALTARDILTRLSGDLPAYMIPRIVRSVDSIAATSSGKKQRSA